MPKYGCDTVPSALRHGAGALRHARQGPMLRYKVCIVTGETAERLRHDFVSQYNARHNRGGMRYGAQGARGRGQTCDTAGLGAVRVAFARKLGQGVHLVHPTQS